MSRTPSGDAGAPGGRDPGNHARDSEAGPAEVNGTALAAIVVAVGNVVFGSFLGLFVPLLPPVFALVSVVLGHLALARIRRTGQAGRGLALTALAVGYLWLFVIALLISGMMMLTGYGFALLGF
ncbi:MULTISPECIES: DUF4190 domain-containing protein [unclassified Dietzia]|uniref:DUF4190 domain-containing protein n=1 Tax=unclassified Dietzia TaxID=2617939 RepID=UPI001315B1FA|nr:MULTISPECIES: DUF4190 domain-containing protein [unclassified Dietzia]MBB1024005.1 DUF4190 domain-containing protein [Dietzia sp. DQ12-76]MBB1027169.1 DUF4190 domain-containing protein [Dietzia sp. DQ11-38-2]QGW23896.1 hypothetical protein GJR88_01337 [Dietzia sp. DQ12-45-1b]